MRDGGIKRQGRCAAKGRPRHAGRGRQRQRPRGEAARSQRQRSTKAAKELCLILRSPQMFVHKISGFVTFRLLTCSSFLRSQIFYASANGAPVMPNAPIVRRFELGGGLFGRLSTSHFGSIANRFTSLRSRPTRPPWLDLQSLLPSWGRLRGWTPVGGSPLEPPAGNGA